MRFEKEGLHMYGIKENIENSYFLSVEYPTIHHNKITSIVSVQLREVDGKKNLLYDISGKTALEEYLRDNSFSYEKCKSFLKAISILLSDLEEYMLEVESISFRPEYIYMKKDDFQWMYLPDQQHEVEKEIEDLFAWLLSKIDYGDEKGVSFIYHVFWCIRNEPFSRKLIEKCLRREEKLAMNQYSLHYSDKKELHKKIDAIDLIDANDKTMEALAQEGYPGSVSEDSLIEPSLTGVSIPGTSIPGTSIPGTSIPGVPIPGTSIPGASISGAPISGISTMDPASSMPGGLTSGECPDFINDRSRESTKKRKRHIILAGEIFIILLSCADMAGAIFLAILCVREGIDVEKSKYMAGCGILMIFFLWSLYRLRCVREKIKEEDSISLPDKASLEEKNWKTKRIEKIIRQNYDWDEEGTVVLGGRQGVLHPILKSIETGEIHMMHTFPYYVGSESGMNQLVIKDKAVSRQHAVFLQGKQTGTYMVCDLHSTNGTWINDRKAVGEELYHISEKAIVKVANHSYEFLCYR